MSAYAILTLLLALQVKHFICDYPLQRHGARKGSAVPSEWVPDLAEHCAVHAVGSILCFLWFGWAFALQVAIIDFAAHAVVDRLKAHKSIGGRWAPSQKMFWMALGFDQFAHHVINLAFVAVAVTP